MRKKVKKSPVFWYEEKGKVKADYVKFVKLMNLLGFYLQKQGNHYQYVCIEKNIVSIVGKPEMKEKIEKYFDDNVPEILFEKYNKESLRRNIYMNDRNLYSRGNLEYLPKFYQPTLQDTVDTCYLTFQNCYVEITKNKVVVGKHKDLPLPVWEPQIINRYFKKQRSKSKISEWEQFISDVCKGDASRMKALMCTLGYLIHTYKNPSDSKISVFLDEQIGDMDEAHGGTGKSLTLSILNRYRNTVTIDGKNFKKEYNHLWQDVTLATQLIVIDDASRYFDFERLYSIITGSMQVNPKTISGFTIPFENSPKLAITTNYSLRGSGGHSEERRKHELEFSETYGPNMDPRKRFGHSLIYDWSDKEWNLCDNFIIECIQFYLQYGLVKSPIINRELRNLVGKTSSDFVQFMDNKMDQGIRKFHKINTYQEFTDENPDFKFKLKTNTLTKWIKRYLEFKKMEYIQTPVNKKTYIEIISDNGGDESNKPTTPTEKPSKKKYKVVENKKGRTTLIKKLVQQQEVCFDVETTSKNAMEAELVGMAFSTKANEGFYVPIPADEQEAVAMVKEFVSIFNNKKIELIGHNIKYDLTVMKRYNITVSCSIFDTMLACYVCSPDTPLKELGLKYLTKKHLGITQTSFEDVVGSGKDEKLLRDIPEDIVGEYACQDVDYTLQLKQIFEKELTDKHLIDLFNDVDAPLIPVLTELDVNGVNIDLGVLKSLDEGLNKSKLKYKLEIKKIAGRELNINSSEQLKELLIDELGLQHPGDKTSKGALSMAKNVLEKMEGEHDVVKLITSCKEAEKLMSDFTQKLPKMINKRTGRLHAVMQNTTTGTGRLSCANPNFQGFPKHNPLGRRIRESVIPSTNNILLTADLSQIQLRLIAHQSGDARMITLFNENADIHRSTAAKVFSITENKVTEEQRSLAKAVNFGLCFGITEHGLAKNTGRSIAEAREFIERYFEEFPGVKKYMEDAIYAVHEKGYSTTIKGRKRFIKEINSYGFARKRAENKAINSPIQGSEADYMKIAMLNIHNAIKKEKLNTKMILCVHDELVFDVPKNEKRKVFKIVKYEMENAIKLKVPVMVDACFGNNWLETH